MSAYIFGAICPKKGKGAGLVLPCCDTAAMNEHLNEISLAVDPGAHAVLILDQAGWHTAPKLVVPANIKEATDNWNDRGVRKPDLSQRPRASM